MLIFEKRRGDGKLKIVIVIVIAIVIVLLTVVSLAFMLNSDINSESESMSEESGRKDPGFEAIFAIAGLLAIIYLVKRRKEET